MRHALVIHPDSQNHAVTELGVSAARAPGRKLLLEYSLAGNLTALRLPEGNQVQRGERLWETTCFEAFVSAPGTAAYYEFNFSPSLEWAAYHFDSYRSGMRDAYCEEAPQIEVRRTGAGLILSAALTLELPDRTGNEALWRVGISAVIEEVNGNKSYWALAHSTGKPDFHHSDCFALELGTTMPL